MDLLSHDVKVHINLYFISGQIHLIYTSYQWEGIFLKVGETRASFLQNLNCFILTNTINAKHCLDYNPCCSGGYL